MPGVRQNIPYIGFNEIVENGETSQEMDLFKRLAAQLQVEQPAVMLATSGTTGLKSKLVVLSMFHLVNGGLQKAEVFKMTHLTLSVWQCHYFIYFAWMSMSWRR